MPSRDKGKKPAKAKAGPKAEKEASAAAKAISEKTASKAAQAKAVPAKPKAPSARRQPAAQAPEIVDRPRMKEAGEKPVTTTGESPEQRDEALRKELLRRRENIVREVKSEISKYIKGENRQLVDTALDDGDWSVVDLSEDISLRQLSTHRENLQKIDIALRKLDEGTYGICEECGEEISLERLQVLPFAIYCREDQEKKEMMEALEREGI